VFVAVALVPPISASAHRYDWAEALQFAILALVAPGLLVAGAPWPQLGLTRAATALAEARRRHPERLRSAAVVGLALACAAAWRTPAAVNRLHAGGWPLALEVVSLTIAGTALWLECVTSPPLIPRSTRPLRIAIAAVSMWTIWILAYMVAMSPNEWYRAYHHVAGGLSQAADQQITAGVMWAVAAGSFIPLIFWNLVQWLRSEEDPDQELYRLVREDRRRAAPPRPTV
jgi:cytochrome c oxidase assembly factor CtaG